MGPTVHGSTPRYTPYGWRKSWTVSCRSLYRVNVSRARHPKKEVEAALRDAEEAGWTVAATRSGHRWGVIRCGEFSRAGC